MAEVCVIVGAGKIETSEIEVREGDYVIAADGGLNYIEAAGIEADMVIGDFDSLGYIPEHAHLKRYPVMKDDTDMMLAVKEGLKLGYRSFRMYGGLGGRLDHTLANLQTLIYLSRQGATGLLIGDGVCVTAVTDGSYSFDERQQGTVSVFCLSGIAKGVTISGMKYELKDGELTSDVPLGVSNAFMEKNSTVTVNDGTVIIMWEKKQK